MKTQADLPLHSALSPDDQPALDAMMARGAWGLAIRGALGTLVGIVVMAAPAEKIMPLAVLASAFMLLEAVFVIALIILRTAHAEERPGLVSREGVAVLSIGAVALIVALTVPAIPFLPMLVAWSLVAGLLVLISARRQLITTGRWWLVLGGLAAVSYGALLLCAAAIDRFAFTLWCGIYTVIFGATLVMLAIRLRLSFSTPAAHDLAAPQGARQG
jgi:uncharacterized membrane protein HdeD (DUF308 family)